MLPRRHSPRGGWEFIRRYVTGWAAAGFVYEAIPLERDAFDLQRRFQGAPRRGFPVHDAVA